MKFRTELTMFQSGKTRVVEVPDDEVTDEEVLGLIFKYGQNDVQKVEGCCSLSAGDLIHLGPAKWLILPVGFKPLDEASALAWRELTVHEKLMRMLS